MALAALRDTVALWHQSFDIAEDLADLDDRYDYREYAGETCKDLDAQVVAQARCIVASIRNTPGP
jgi:hypothetical protein